MTGNLKWMSLKDVMGDAGLRLIVKALSNPDISATKVIEMTDQTDVRLRALELANHWGGASDVETVARAEKYLKFLTASGSTTAARSRSAAGSKRSASAPAPSRHRKRR